MKKLMLMMVMMAFAVQAQTLVPRISWAVETSGREFKRLDLEYGSTWDLECTFKNYGRPLSIDGATVILHGTTNGQAEGSSYQVSGTAGSNGLARIRLAVDAWIPQGLSNVSYTVEVVQTNSARVLRARGTAYLFGTSAVFSNTPLPFFCFTNAVPRQRTITINGQRGELSSDLVFNVIQPESDTNALAALASLGATNQPSRFYTTPFSWIEPRTNSFSKVSITWKIISETLTYWDGGGSPDIILAAGSYDVAGIPFPLHAGNYGSEFDVQVSDDAGSVWVSLATQWKSAKKSGTNLVWDLEAVPPYYGSAQLCGYTSETAFAEETYAAKDHAAFVAEGGELETLVSDLSAQIATAALNTHTGQAQPHSGKYPLQTGGVMTNTTLINPNVSGDSIIGSGGVTNVMRSVSHWQIYSNVVGAVTLTNLYESPIYLNGTGTINVAWQGLRSPYPVYLVARGMDALKFLGSYGVCGATFQTNMSNHFIFWSYGTNILFNAITTTED